MGTKMEKFTFHRTVYFIFFQGKYRFLLLGALLILQLYLLWLPAAHRLTLHGETLLGNRGNVIVGKEPEESNNLLVSMDDAWSIGLIRSLLAPPSTGPYNFTNKDLARKRTFNPSAGQTQAVADILEGFGRNGFYLDYVSKDGEWYSNTVWLERKLGWSGLLLEPDPQLHPLLLGKRRRAYVGNICLSDTRHPKTMEFYLDTSNCAGNDQSDICYSTTTVNIPCFPLYSILMALNRTTVDFFSLDNEGSEIRVLQTIPFDKVIFKVITIEHNALKEGKTGLRKFMEGHGYIFFRTVVTEDFTAGDSIFIHQSVNLTAAQRARIGIEDAEKVRVVQDF